MQRVGDIYRLGSQTWQKNPVDVFHKKMFKAQGLRIDKHFIFTQGASPPHGKERASRRAMTMIIPRMSSRSTRHFATLLFIFFVH